MTRPRHARLKLLAIVALFAAPIAAALVLNALGWRPVAERNHGTLVEPARDFRATVAHDAGGAAIAWANAKGRWRVLVTLPEKCGASCARTIDALHRVWLGLGTRAGRVEVLVAGVEHADVAAREALARFERARAITLAVPPPSPPGDAEYLPAQVIDPHGYYVLRYDAGYDPNGLRKDLRRLLR
jgi:hypothetical protein